MLNSIQIKQQSMQDKNYSKKYLTRIIIADSQWERINKTKNFES